MELVFIMFGFLLLKLTWESYHLHLYRRENPFCTLKHPATEELREIYREIDRDAMITDPDLLTPEKPKTTPLQTATEKLNLGSRFLPLAEEERGQAWVNVSYSLPDKPGLFQEMHWPRVPVNVFRHGNNYDIVSDTAFPKWDGPTAKAIVIVYLSPNKETHPRGVATQTNDPRIVRNGDRLVLHGVTVEKKFPTAQAAIAEMRKLQLHEVKQITKEVHEERDYMAVRIKELEDRIAQQRRDGGILQQQWQADQAEWLAKIDKLQH